MLDRRQEEQVKCFLKAKIVFNKGLSSFECIIKNISSEGARLAVSQHFAVPQNFDLEIPIKSKTFHAQIRWRDGDWIGVAFLGEETTHEGSDESLEHVQAENKRLRAAVQTLSKRLKDLGQDVDVSSLR